MCLYTDRPDSSNDAQSGSNNEEERNDNTSHYPTNITATFSSVYCGRRRLVFSVSVKCCVAQSAVVHKVCSQHVPKVLASKLSLVKGPAAIVNAAT